MNDFLYDYCNNKYMEVNFYQIAFSQIITIESGVNAIMMNLTQREHDVMKFLLQGKSNKEISRILCITPHTIKAHLDSIYRKFDVHNRVLASMKYIQYYSERIDDNVIYPS